MSKMEYSSAELMIINAARLLRDGDVVFVGVGQPNLACNLAKRTHAPNLVMIYEAGVIGAEPARLPLSIGDPTLVSGSLSVVSMYDIFANYLQRGNVDVGFMGGAQIDRFGNLNSSFIGDADNPKIRLPGTGGGNDISSLTNMIVAMKHEKRRFVPEVDFITSPGWIKGGHSRAESGLPQGGMWRVVTDLAVMGFDQETREMQVLTLQQGVTREKVQENTGFKLRFADRVETAEPPKKEELEILHELDPDRLYTA